MPYDIFELDIFETCLRINLNSNFAITIPIDKFIDVEENLYTTIVMVMKDLKCFNVKIYSTGLIEFNDVKSLERFIEHHLKDILFEFKMRHI